MLKALRFFWIVGLVSGLGSAAHAARVNGSGWSGDWRGQAQIEEVGARTIDCGMVEISMHFLSNPASQELWLTSGLPSCGAKTDFFPNIEMEVEDDGTLHYHDQDIGTLAESHIRILHYLQNQRDGSPNHKEFIDLNLDPSGRMIYRNVVSFPQGKEFIITAVLNPSL
jgi:hypothetical protein